jgi:group I intron endonuclease
MNKGVIYCIKNKVNEKRYIGQTSDLTKRFSFHRCYLSIKKHHCEHLQRSWDKYGPESFEWIILEACPIKALTEREQHWMDYYRNKGIYNTAPAAGTTRGVKHSLEVRKRQSERLKGIPRPPEVVAKIAAANRGKKRTKEQCEKMSTVLMGRKIPMEVIERRSASARGAKRSEATKLRMSMAQKGRAVTPEAVEKRRETIRKKMQDGYVHGNKGRKCTAEAIAKNSTSHKGLPLTEDARTHLLALSAAAKGKSRYNEDIKNEIKRLFANGMKFTNIAKSMNLNKSSVGGVVRGIYN